MCLGEFLVKSVFKLQVLLDLLMNCLIIHLHQTVEDVDASVGRDIISIHILQVVLSLDAF